MSLIIFDCDGTLVDSELLCNLALEYQLAELGVECQAKELLKKYRGGKLANIVLSLETEFSIQLPNTFEKDYRLKVTDLFDKHLKANDGVKEILESLTVPYCIASSAPQAKIQQALKVTGLAKYFNENIFSSYDVGSWKPEPGLFLHAAKVMGVAPNDCYVVEDSLLGVEAANRACMKSIYYAPEVNGANKLGAQQIQHMSQLSELIL
ncbi:MAG: HAD-IA family hydrolase [Oceanospirillaceae bacterium]|nr:HAD-IA family hydrolase [Oceanospirillaceae bacterium]